MPCVKGVRRTSETPAPSCLGSKHHPEEHTILWMYRQLQEWLLGSCVSIRTQEEFCDAWFWTHRQAGGEGPCSSGEEESSMEASPASLEMDERPGTEDKLMVRP